MAVLVCVIFIAFKYKGILHIKSVKLYRSLVVAAVVSSIGAIAAGALGSKSIRSFTRAHINNCPTSYPYQIPVLIFSAISVGAIAWALYLAFKSKQFNVGLITIILLVLVLGISYFAWFVSSFCVSY